MYERFESDLEDEEVEELREAIEKAINGQPLTLALDALRVQTAWCFVRSTEYVGIEPDAVMSAIDGYCTGLKDLAACYGEFGVYAAESVDSGEHHPIAN